MTGRRALLLVLGVALVVRLANLGWTAGQPLAEYQTEWTESDMQAYWEWSGRILHGDLLGREAFHPFTSWMRQIAPLETWHRWWGGPQVFYKAPLYPYILAAVRLVAGDSFWGVGLFQLGLGLANVALVFLLAEALFGTAVAIVAGLGAGLYGPALLHETVVLRDVLGVTVSLLLLWWLARCAQRGPRAWLVAGVLFAVALLAREVTALFAPCVLLWIVQREWPRWRAIGVTAAAFAAGVAIGLLPLVARNVTVEAPPLALSALGTEAIVYGHAAGAAAVGFQLPASSQAILRESDGHILDAIRLTVASYGGDWWALVRLEATRAAAIFAAYEPADNVNWYYFADRGPLLRWTLRWEMVLALGLVGVWLSPRVARSDQRFLLYFLVISLVSLQYAPVVGRYRLVPAAVLVVYAGVTLVWLGRAAAAGRWPAAVGAATATLAIALVSQGLLAEQATRHRARAAEYSLAAQVYIRRGQPERAYDELRTGLEEAWVGPDQPVLPFAYAPLARGLVGVASQIGRRAEAARVLERLIVAYPADPNLPRLLERVRPAPG
jgi:4-amino-4-deoxy-L-arabinose transferase-like glycosyltransferase